MCSAQAVLFCWLGSLAAQQDAHDILEKYERALARSDRIAFEAETLTNVEGAVSDDVSHRWRSRHVFVRDGGRLDWQGERWSLEAKRGVDPTRPLLANHAVLDNQYYAEYTVAAQDARTVGRGITSKRLDDARARILGALDGGASLDGYLSGDDGLRITDILANAPDLRVEGSARVDGVECLVLRGTTDRGTYALWLDAALDYQARRISVVKRGTNILDGKAVTDPPAQPDPHPKFPNLSLSEYSLTVQNIALEKLEGAIVPTGAEIVQVLTYRDGQKVTWRIAHSRKKVVLKPDFAARRAFMLDAPEGTRFSDQEDRKLTHVWQHGRLVPHVWQGNQLVPATAPAPGIAPASRN